MFAQLIWWMVFHHLEDQYYFHFPDFGNTTILCFSSKDHYFLVYWLCNYYYLYWYEKWITWRCQQWRCNAIVPSGSCCGLLVLTTRTLSIRMRRPAGQWRTEVQTLTSLRHKSRDGLYNLHIVLWLLLLLSRSIWSPISSLEDCHQDQRQTTLCLHNASTSDSIHTSSIVVASEKDCYLFIVIVVCLWLYFSD